MTYVLLFVVLFLGTAVTALLWIIGQAILAELRVFNAGLKEFHDLVEGAILGIQRATPDTLRPPASDAVTYVDERADLRREMRRQMGIVSPVEEEVG